MSKLRDNTGFKWPHYQLVIDMLTRFLIFPLIIRTSLPIMINDISYAPDFNSPKFRRNPIMDIHKIRVNILTETTKHVRQRKTAGQKGCISSWMRAEHPRVSNTACWLWYYNLRTNVLKQKKSGPKTGHSFTIQSNEFIVLSLHGIPAARCLSEGWGCTCHWQYRPAIRCAH